MLVVCVVSGGQTGVDRAALDAALTEGVPYAGWCPGGGWAEDLPTPPGVLERYPLLRPTPTVDPEVRTRWNVRDSDATLVLMMPGEGRSAEIAGTVLAMETAASLRRPVEAFNADDVDAVTAWVAALPGQCTLNVAGPRESERPGIHAAAYATVLVLLERLGAGGQKPPKSPPPKSPPPQSPPPQSPPALSPPAS